MALAPGNHFKADLRAIRFTLWDHLGTERLFKLERFAHLSREECDAVIDQAYRFATEVTGPLNSTGDRTGCHMEGGRVVTPPGFREAWRKLFEVGLMPFTIPAESGGFGGPSAVGVVLQELQSGANTAFQMYPGLTHGAADLMEHFALDEDRKRFLPAMLDGRYSGTMCLSEPHAGSDVGATRTRARHIEGNVYAITGTKCWISAGDHDLTQNIVHMVLARIEGAPTGTKGLSLFIVPKVWVNDDGTLGEPNDVTTASIEHKLGIRASATAVLNFGDAGRCRGILVGGQPHEGMRQMFRMMNGARIAVGVQGIAVASTAYLNALGYARERQQGSSIRNFKDPNAPRVAILEHSDIRRLLVEMKAKVEGTRALAIKLALHADLARALADSDPGAAAHHEGQVDLLTPVVKAYSSDQAFRIAEMAVQIYGGAGFVEDHPAEQYLRDAKIFSIYEGTNHIQALDLVSRKLRIARRRELLRLPQGDRRLRRRAFCPARAWRRARRAGRSGDDAAARCRGPDGLLHGRQARPGHAGGQPVPRDAVRGGGGSRAAGGGRRGGRPPAPRGRRSRARGRRVLSRQGAGREVLRQLRAAADPGARECDHRR